MITQFSKILLVGGSGTLGKVTAPLLMQAGYQIRLMTRHPEKISLTQSSDVEIVKGEINCVALSVITTFTSAPLFTKSLIKKADLYAAMLPVMPRINFLPARISMTAVFILFQGNN